MDKIEVLDELVCDNLVDASSLMGQVLDIAEGICDAMVEEVHVHITGPIRGAAA